MALVPFTLATSSNAATHAAGSTNYHSLASGCWSGVSSSETIHRVTWRTPGTLSLLTVSVAANNRAASTVRARKNGANGNQSVSVPGSTSGVFQDTTNTDAVSAGDLLAYQVVAGTGGTVFTIRSLGNAFAATTNTVLRYGRGYSGAGMSDDNRTWLAGGSVGGAWVSSTGNGVVRSAAGTYKHGACYIGTNTRNGAATFYFRLNAADTALAIAIPSATTGIFEDTTSSVTAALNDLVEWRMALGGTTGLVAGTLPSVDFETTGSSINWIAWGQASITAGTTRYLVPSGEQPGSPPSAESDAQVANPAATTATGLAINLPTNTATNGGTVTLRRGGVDTALAIAVPAATTGWFSTSGSAALSTLDLLSVAVAIATGSGSVTSRGLTMTASVTPPNTAPIVNAGVDQTITLPSTATMAATVTDDGLPNPPATVTLTWSKTSGPGTVSFSPSASVEDPVVTFSTDGVYVLRLTASDSVLSAYDEVTITVGQSAPIVNAGPDQSGINILEVVQLAGSASDDGFPNPPGALTYTWTKQSGPGTATFSSTSILAPTVTLSAEGVYVLRLTASDSVLSAFDEMTITVGSAVDPGNSICGDENVLAWIEQTYTLTNDTTETRVTSDAPLNDPSEYYFGRKEARILELPTISRQLSDTRGQWQAGTMRWREAEVDRIVRSRYAGATTYPVTNTTDVCRMIRESDWRDRETARLMFVGHRLRSTPAENLSIEHESGDVLARDLVKAGQEQQSPRRQFNISHTPGIPADLIEIPEPIIYGRVSDALSTETPPELIATSETGGFMDGGLYPNHGWAPMPGPTPPASLTLGEIGTGSLMLGDVGGNAFYFNIVGINAGGQFGDFAYFAPSSSPSLTITGDNKSIQVSWTNPGGSTAVTWRVAMGFLISGAVRYIQTIDVSGATTSVTFDNCPDFTEVSLADYTQLATGAVPNPYTAFVFYRCAARLSDGSVTALNSVGGFGGTAVYRRTVRIEIDVATLPALTTELLVYRLGAGWVPGQPTYGYFAVPVTQTLPISGHVYVDDDWIGTGLSSGDPEIEEGAWDLSPYYGGQELVPYDGVYWHRWFVASHACAQVDVYVDGEKLGAHYGLDWLAPGHVGYAERFGHSHIRVFNGRTYAVVYGSPTVGSANDVAAGSKTIRANVWGVETAGDGPGTLITDIHDQFKHWWINFFLQDYQTGPWLGVPTWEPIAGWPKVNTGSWDAAKAAAAAAFGAELAGAGVIAEQASKREWLARWLISTGTRIGINAGGQWTLVRHNPDASTATHTYTEVRHVQAGSLTFDPLHDEHWTRIAYRFNLRDGIWAEATAIDDDAEDDLEEERPGPTHDLYFVASATVAAFVMNLVRDRHSTLPWRVSFETINLCGTNSDLGDVDGLTHTAGLDVDGWTNFLVMVEGHATLSGAARTRITGRTNQAPHD